MLHWVLEPDERATVEAFVDIEAGTASTTRTLFVRLSSSFRDDVERGQHGLKLFVELLRHHEQLRDLQTPTGAAEWEPPPPVVGDDVGTLVQAARSFHRHHADSGEHLGLVLTPRHVTRFTSYSAWLARFVVASAATSGLRLAVLDSRAIKFTGVARMAGVRTVIAGFRVSHRARRTKA